MEMYRVELLKFVEANTPVDALEKALRLVQAHPEKFAPFVYDRSGCRILLNLPTDPPAAPPMRTAPLVTGFALTSLLALVGLLLWKLVAH